MLSKEPEVAHQGVLGALVASGVLSGEEREVDEEDREEQHHSQEEAWGEEVLSYLEAKGELRERQRRLTD